MSAIPDWLSKLKAGDEVIVDCGLGVRFITRVASRTPSGRIRLANGREFHPGGRLRGGNSWEFDSLREPTPEALEAIRLSKIRKRLSRVRWDRVPVETVRQVAALLRACDEWPSDD